MSNSKNQPNNRISEDVNLSSMTKELRDTVWQLVKNTRREARERDGDEDERTSFEADKFIALIESYAAEREKQAIREGVESMSKKKLPKVRTGLLIDHALYLEMLDILVEEGVISQEKAVERYEKRLAEFTSWEKVEDDD